MEKKWDRSVVCYYLGQLITGDNKYRIVVRKRTEMVKSNIQQNKKTSHIRTAEILIKNNRVKVLDLLYITTGRRNRNINTQSEGSTENYKT